MKNQKRLMASTCAKLREAFRAAGAANSESLEVGDCHGRIALAQGESAGAQEGQAFYLQRLLGLLRRSCRPDEEGLRLVGIDVPADQGSDQQEQSRDCKFAFCHLGHNGLSRI